MKLRTINIAAIILLWGSGIVSAAGAYASDANFTVGAGSNANVTGLLYRMIVMVLAVVLLGAAVIYLSKKMLPKFNLPGKKIQIIEAVHLGPRKSLHLIKVGSKTLLIGSTNENISHLADLSNHTLEVNSPVVCEN